MNRRSLPIRSSTRRRAFTLVELMIAIALVLILMVGINQVFKMTTDTVGAGQALNAASRDLRGAQSVFFNDLHGAVTQNPPAFIIRCEQTTAFRNRADELGDRDYAAAAATATSSVSNANTAAMEAAIRTIDLNNNGTEGEVGVPGEIISPALYGDRSHRTDKLIFFARGYFPRQTGNDGTFAANMSSNEAYIWYGQLRMPNNDDPMVSNNYRGLGPDFRSAWDIPQAPWTYSSNPNNFYASQWILGREVLLLREKSGGTIVDNGGITQVFIDRGVSANQNSIAPLANSSQSSDNNYYITDSRFDLAATSIDGYRTILSNYFADWPNPVNEKPWWNIMGNWRYRANPFPHKPMNSEGVASTVPLFLNNCSQFIVEYAGDFLTQENDPANANYGKVMSAGPDGKIDYLIVVLPDGTRVAQTRWYGLPRDTNGDGVINLLDVVPLCDVRYAASITPTYVSFEQEVPTASPQADYAAVIGGVPTMPAGARYTVAWGPDTTGQPMPKMIRIVATVDDPAGRMATGQTMEYVIDLP